MSRTSSQDHHDYLLFYFSDQDREVAVFHAATPLAPSTSGQYCRKSIIVNTDPLAVNGYHVAKPLRLVRFSFGIQDWNWRS